MTPPKNGEKRRQWILALGLIAIGLTAFNLDEHQAGPLTLHQKVQLAIAAIGFLLAPIDVTPAKEKLAVVATVIPWMRRSSSARVLPPASGDDQPVNDQ